MLRKVSTVALIFLAVQATATLNGVAPSVSLGNGGGKTAVWLSSSAATTAIGAGVVLSSRTTTTGKTFYLQHFDVFGYESSGSTSTVSNMGSVILLTPTGVTAATMTFVYSGQPTRPWQMDFSEPVPIASLVTVALKVTPNTATAITWLSNLIGYEK